MIWEEDDQDLLYPPTEDDLKKIKAAPVNKAKQATYRIIHFTTLDKYIGVAWNYNEAVLVSTTDFPTYTEARKQLKVNCKAVNVELKWFDGEYDCVDGSMQIYPIDAKDAIDDRLKG